MYIYVLIIVHIMDFAHVRLPNGYCIRYKVAPPPVLYKPHYFVGYIYHTPWTSLFTYATTPQCTDY